MLVKRAREFAAMTDADWSVAGRYRPAVWPLREKARLFRIKVDPEITFGADDVDLIRANLRKWHVQLRCLLRVHYEWVRTNLPKAPSAQATKQWTTSRETLQSWLDEDLKMRPYATNERCGGGGPRRLVALKPRLRFYAWIPVAVAFRARR
jgi:hypothetical protein